MKNVDLEIKRMLGLLESKMGNVKTIISEQETSDEINFTEPEKWLNWVEKSGCLAGKPGFDKLTDIYKVNPKNIDLYKKSGINIVLPNDLYRSFVMNNKEGDINQFYIFGKKGNGPEGSFLLLRNDKNKTECAQNGVNCFSEHHLVCPQRTATKSLVSDTTELTADQLKKLKLLIGEYGIKSSGWQLTIEIPTGKDGFDYEPVDLNTGLGVNNKKEYIDPQGLAGLGSEFKQPGKYYVWAKKGTSLRLADTVTEVEKLLNQAGYSKDENIDAEPTSLVDLCKSLGGYCEKHPIIQRYIDAGNGNVLMYPLDAESYKKMGASTVRAGKTQRGIRQIQKTEASKRKCRVAISTLHNCMRADSDSSCKQYIESAYSQMGENIPPYMKARIDLANQIEMCQNLNIDVGGKYEGMWDELKTSSSEYSPYSVKNKQAASTGNLEESLSRNIRLSLKEIKRKTMR